MYGKRWCGTSLSMSPLKVPTPMAVSLGPDGRGGASAAPPTTPLLQVATASVLVLMCSASACFVDCHLHTESGVQCCGHLAGGSDPRLLNPPLPSAPVSSSTCSPCAGGMGHSSEPLFVPARGSSSSHSQALAKLAKPWGLSRPG